MVCKLSPRSGSAFWILLFSQSIMVQTVPFPVPNSLRYSVFEDWLTVHLLSAGCCNLVPRGPRLSLQTTYNLSIFTINFSLLPSIFTIPTLNILLTHIRHRKIDKMSFWNLIRTLLTWVLTHILPSLQAIYSRSGLPGPLFAAFWVAFMFLAAFFGHRLDGHMHNLGTWSTLVRPLEAIMLSGLRFLSFVIPEGRSRRSEAIAKDWFYFLV